jgi:hypothetical protein
MANQPEQTTNQDAIDPVVEALIRELIETPSHPKTARKTTSATLTEELMAVLLPSTRTAAKASSVETVILAEALAPALAEALAPALAEALAPALEKALSNLVSPKKTSQETGSKRGSDKQEQE